MLYQILPNALSLNYDPIQNLQPHVDGFIGSANAWSIDLVTKQLKELSLRDFVVEKALSSSSTPTQSADVHFVQLSTNRNGSHQPGWNRKKGCKP
jgi:hypothetical protein